MAAVFDIISTYKRKQFVSRMPFTLGKLYAHKNGVFTAQLSKFHCTKTGKHMGALRETPRNLGFCSPGSPRFHFTFHFRIHFHKNRLFKCTCEAKPKILTKRWGDSDLLRGQRMAFKQTSTIWSWVPITCITPQGPSVKAGFVCYKTRNRSINEK